ncbi:MAG: hypothetical protein IPO81_10775 [Kouleothrix sp.]|nr:hypothetical protein [Kouleothrix sp.]
MRVTINGEQTDVPVTLRRAATSLESDALLVGDWVATRVTHSHQDDIPVIVQVDEIIIEMPRQAFYQLPGMSYDWQPGDSSQSVGGA